MGYVFNSNTTVWFRIKIWIKDLIAHLKSLPSYIRPTKLKPKPLSKDELEEYNKLEEIE